MGPCQIKVQISYPSGKEPLSLLASCHLNEVMLTLVETFFKKKGRWMFQHHVKVRRIVEVVYKSSTFLSLRPFLYIPWSFRLGTFQSISLPLSCLQSTHISPIPYWLFTKNIFIGFNLHLPACRQYSNNNTCKSSVVCVKP